MKATGIVRRIDDLGRVVIPKEIRRTLRIREGDPLEIFTESNGEVIFKENFTRERRLDPFFDDGRIVKLTIEGDTPLETNYTYDDDGQIIRIESGDRVYTREYEYNSEGQVSKRVQTSPDGKVTPAVYEYTTEGDYTVVTMKEDVPVNTYTILRTYKMYFYNGEYLTRIEYSASKTRKTYEFSYNYIWAPKHDQNEEFYHELYLMQEYF